MEAVSTDEAFLASLGYKQEFKRQFSRLDLFGVAFSIIGLLPSIASVLIFALPNGGTTAVVWGWAVCSFMILFIALAMAELGSAMPTSGGLYYWTFTFSPPHSRKFLSWIVGYSNSVGLVANIASIDWGCAIQIGAIAGIGSDMQFTLTTRQTFGVFVALLIAHASICSLATRVLARLQIYYIILNVCLCFAVIIGLPAATPKQFKNSASYALTGFSNLNGWPNGYAFVLSFLAPVWTINAFDSSVHISEEASNARTAVPFAIISSSLAAAVLGWGINMAMVFNMGTDIESIVNNPIGQPLAAIFFNSFGKTGTLVLWSFLIITQFMMGSSELLAASRQQFAFARDKALPFSSYIRRVNGRNQIPLVSVWTSAFLGFCLGLLAFAGPTAINAIFSLSVCAQYVAYAIPILAFATAQGTERVKKGPFSLGRYSVPVAVIAVAWMTLMCTVVLFPSTPAPSATDMNYAVVVIGGVLVLAVIYYFPRYGGKYWFEGPLGALKKMEDEKGLPVADDNNLQEEKGGLDKNTGVYVTESSSE